MHLNKWRQLEMMFCNFVKIHTQADKKLVKYWSFQARLQQHVMDPYVGKARH